MIKYEKLPLDKYYRYQTLREKVKKYINQEPNNNFLYLVSEMEIKRNNTRLLKMLKRQL
jgi:hypothetical protein